MMSTANLNQARRQAFAKISRSIPRQALIFAFIGGTVSLALNAYWLSAIGVGAFIYYLVRLLLEAGKDIPIESFIVVIAALQWIIAPLLAYAGVSDHDKYYMYVPEEKYMALSVPGVILLSIGLYSLRSHNRILLVWKNAVITKELVYRAKNLPYYLIAVGFIFSFFNQYFPPALAFPAYVLSNIKYIGLVYLIFSDRLKNKRIVLIAAFILTFLSSLQGAMFHDLILWSAFIGMYAAYLLKPKLRSKVFMTLAALAFIFVIQAVKDEYRQLLKEQGASGYIAKFAYSVEERVQFDEDLVSNNMERLVVRFNQGWIISRIMQNVPDLIPHASGETIVTAIKAALLPRILFPDKPVAGGRENYEKYTGFMLQSSTSMGISILGEAYINFGLEGAWVFMLVFGFVSSFVIQRFFLLARKYPTIWLWLPLILLHFVKAETELLVQLNFMVKTIVLVMLFVWANNKFLKMKL